MNTSNGEERLTVRGGPDRARLGLPRVNPAVLWQRLPDGAVLLDPKTEIYFGLDPVGARVWELIAGEKESLDELVAAIVGDYPDADAATVRMDLAELIEQLECNGLLLQPVTNGRLDFPAKGHA
jgi:hypothetical protein